MPSKKPTKKPQRTARKAQTSRSTGARGKNVKAPKARPRRQSGGGFMRFLLSPAMRRLLLFVIVVVLLAVFWSNIEDFFRNLLDTFGWGLAFIVAVIAALVTLAVRRRLGSLIFRWYRWLGAFAFILAVWGILAAVNYTTGSFNRGLGGTFGQSIIGLDAGAAAGMQSLRIIALFIIGTVLVAPKATFRGIRKTFAWLATQFTRRPVPRGMPRPARDTRQPAHRTLEPRPGTPAHREVPEYMTEPLVPPEVTSSRKKLEELAARAAALRPSADKVTPPAKEKPKPARSEKPSAAEPRKEDKPTIPSLLEEYTRDAELKVVDGWPLPPLDLLDATAETQFSQADNTQRAELIEETLASYGVDTKVVQINAGPTVTQFGVEPGWDRKYKEVREKDENGKISVHLVEVSKTRVKAGRISSLSNDLALALAAPSIRIEAPVPGKTYVGVEVPNVTSGLVSLRSVIETSTFQKLMTRTKLAVALGKGAGGESVAADLAKMPHLLIAGATGSGKTVCLNTVICGLLMFNTPNDLRFILIDPKRVELVQYNSVPHLATPVIVDTPKALAALRWLCQEMDERYQKFSRVGARNIESYNKNKTGADRMPYLILVIDELADLMMAGFEEVETNLCRLAQLARATGIHLVVATQRPSVDVVTGLIKANFPTRLSFAVTSQIDSRTILDGPGAEKLLGHGDMLYLPTDAAKPKRLQGCFLSDAEIDRLVYFWGNQQAEAPDALRLETLVATTPNNTIGGHPIDSLLEQAKALARQYSEVSTSFLQRKLHIGYPRAARLKEQLDAALEAEQAENDEAEPDDLDVSGFLDDEPDNEENDGLR
jgi:S-DNA-T family DNA segregation ATPase FtsK/SpoIIIE